MFKAKKGLKAKKELFTKKELKHLAVAIAVLGLVFGWNDGSETLEIVYWLRNFVMVLAVVIISLLVHEIAHKFVARAKGATCEYSIWGIRQYWFRKHWKFKRPFPLGVIVALLLMLVSAGKAFWAAIGTNKIEAQRELRVGRKYVELTGFEEATIALAGPFASTALALIFNSIDKVIAINFSPFVTVNLWLALYSFLPLSTLSGSKIFFGSRYLYVFGLVFVIAAFGLRNLGLLSNLILSFVLAVGILVLYFFARERA